MLFSNAEACLAGHCSGPATRIEGARVEEIAPFEVTGVLNPTRKRARRGSVKTNSRGRHVLNRNTNANRPSKLLGLMLL